MIRKGTALSRIVALAVIFGPLLLAVLTFIVWAVTSWSDAGARIESARGAIHKLRAERSQAQLYQAIGANWAEYANAANSGLVQERDMATARAALTKRVEALFREANGSAAVSVIGAKTETPGLEVISAEANGVTPEATLPRLFDALEGEEPFLFVDFIDLRRAAPRGQEKMVALRLRFSAFRLVDTAPKGSAEPPASESAVSAGEPDRTVGPGQDGERS